MIYAMQIRGVVVSSSASQGAVPSVQPIEIARGGDYRILCFVVDSLGVPFDLTGYTCALVVRETATSPTPTIARAGILEDAVNGLVSFPVSQTDTAEHVPATLYYDVWITDPEGDRLRIVDYSTFVIDSAASLPGDAVTSPPQSGWVDFDVEGPTSIDVAFADGFQFVVPYSALVSSYLPDGISVSVGPRSGDPPAPAPLASTGFQITASAAFTGRVYWYARASS